MEEAAHPTPDLVPEPVYGSSLRAVAVKVSGPLFSHILHIFALLGLFIWGLGQRFLFSTSAKASLQEEEGETLKIVLPTPTTI